MKNMMIILSMFLLTISVHAVGESPATVDPTISAPVTSPRPAARPSPAGEASAQQQQGFSSCSQADYYIQPQCTGNPSYMQYQANSSAWRQMSAGGRDTGAKANLEQGQTQVTAAMMSIDEMMKVCSDSYKSCLDICGQEHQRASAQTPQNTTAMNQANTTANKCNEEFKKMTTQAQAAKMDLSQILQTIMAALQMLQGMGGDSATAALSNPEEDPCEGQYKDILVECKDGQSDPSSRSAGLNTGVGSLNGVSNDGLFQASSQGEPGGTNKNSKAKGSSPSMGGGGMGSFGGGSGGSSMGASSASGDAEKGLDTDIQRGFMSADGGGSGGGGGGGSSPSGAAFGKFGSGAGESLAQTDSLQKKLSKIASQEKRGLASSGDTNGPFQDNWEIIKKAYKHNTQSMYHQK